MQIVIRSARTKQLKSGDDMVEVEIGKEQAQDFARVIFADILSYIQSHQDEFEAFMKEREKVR